MTLSTELARLAEVATPGEWVVSYGADERQGMGVATDIRIRDLHPEFGSMIALLHNPGVPEAEANAQLIATMCSETNRKAIIAALKAAEQKSGAGVAGPSQDAPSGKSHPASGTAETPLGDVAGLVNEARLDAKAFREHNVYDSEGDPVRLIHNAARLDQYADAITALTRQLAERDAENKRLRAVVVRYGDRIRMAMAPAELQQTIDEALGGDNGK